MNKILPLFLLISLNSIAQNFSFDESYWETDGPVNAIVHDSSTNSVFLGGNFQYIGPKANFGSILENNENVTCPEPDNVVNVSIPDGNGGWYVGGNFTSIGTHTRERIAHIDANGNIIGDLGKSGFNNDVTSLFLDDSILYVGGEFTLYSDNNTRKRSAEFSMSDFNNLNMSFPQANGEVYCSIPDGNGGYFIAGSFTIIGDSTRNKLAHVTNAGIVSSWNPNVNCLVGIFSIDKSNDIVFVSCVNFSPIDLFTSTIYQINATTGEVAPQTVTANGYVYATRVVGDTLFIGGEFSSISGLTRNNFAVLNANSFSLLGSPSANFNGIVNTIENSDSKLFIGGSFTEINGQTRKRFASLNLSSLNLNDLTINSDGEVKAMYFKDSILYIGGDFDTLNSNVRRNFGAYNVLSNSVTNQVFDFNSSVSTIAGANGLLFIGGNFYQVNLLSSNNIAIINPINGVFYPNEINPLSIVNTIAISGNNVFIGGNFMEAGIKYRTRLCSINLNNSLLTNWKPASNNTVFAISKFNGKIVAGGSFTTINGLQRNYFAAIDGVTGALDSYNPSPNNNVKCFQVIDSVLYIVGKFTSFNGQSRGYGAAISLNNQLLTWNPNANNWINSIRNSGNDLFIAGKFITLSGQPRELVGKVNTTTGLVDNWTPQVLNVISPSSVNSVNEVYSIEIDQNKVIVGGWFYEYLNSGKNYLVAIDGNSGLVDDHFPNSDSRVFSISKSNNKFYVGGNFKSIGGRTVSDLVQIDLTTKRPTSWRPSTDWKVLSLQIKDSILFVGGNFSAANGLSRHGLASYNIITGNLTNWAPTVYHPSGVTSSYIYSMALSDDNLYVSGSFTQINGTSRNGLASFNLTTGNLSDWGPVFSSGGIHKLKIHEDMLYVLGAFTMVNGNSRNGVCSFDDNTGNLLPFTIDPILSSVSWKALDFHDNSVYINGATDTSGVYAHTIRLDKLTGQLIEFFNEDPTLSSSWSLNAVNQSFITTVSTPSFPLGIHLKQFNYFNQDPSPNVLVWNLGSASSAEMIGNQTFVFGEFQNLNNIGKKYLAVANLSDLIINPQIDTVEACNFYTWSQNNQTYTQSGIYTNYFTASSGADSVIVLNLTVHQATHSHDTINSCQPIIWIDGNIYAQSNGTSTFTLANSNGCDSIVHLHYTLLPPLYDTIQISSCNSFYWQQTSQTYVSSGFYTDTIFSNFDCDSVVTIDLTIILPDTTIDLQTSCDSLLWIDGNTYYTNTNAPYFILTNGNGCDSVVNLNLTIIPSQTAINNTFSMPSAESTCNGLVSISTIGNPDFEMSIDGGIPFTSGGYSLQSDLCLGIHELQVIDFCNDTLYQTFVIPVDSNYIFNNPFIDSIAIDSLGSTITDCDIYYNSIDTAFIDSAWAIGNQVNVIWNIVGPNGSNFDTMTYDLNNGFGVYWLQLSVFCPTNATEDYFSVTQAIYFGNGEVATVGMKDSFTSDHAIVIYPNPTTGNVTITFHSKTSTRVKIIDVQGKFIQENRLMSGECLSLEHVESGVYFLNMEIEGKKTIRKIFKQ